MKEDIIILLAGLLSGFLSEIGGAGSLLSLPMLISLGIPPVVANGSNRVAVFSLYTSAYARYVYTGKRIYDPKYISELAVPIILGTVCGAVSANILPDAFMHWAIIGFSIALIILNSHTQIRDDIMVPRVAIKLSIKNFLLLFGAGTYAGLIQSGMTYIFFYIFANILLIDYPASKYLKFYFSMFVTPIALVVFMFFANINFKVGFLLLIGGAIGGWIGSYKIEHWDINKDRYIIKLSIVFSVLYLIVFMLRYVPKGILFI